MPAPLDGLFVLDLSRVLSGPYCTMNLGDLGAEVVKVEEPKSGDDTRAFGPPFVEGESTYFLSINRNKQSLAVDLKSPEGVQLVQRLAEQADVLVENFRPGVAKRLGLGHEALRAKNPRLIYCSISGFGASGDPAYSALPGYDAIVQGLSGLQYVTGQPDGPPTRIGVPISDLLSGLAAFQAILAALYTREKTGEGAYLDLSMLDATAAVLTFHSSSALNAGTTPKRLGNRHASIAPYETFQASDAYFNVAVGNDAQFKALCELLELPHLSSEERFATNPARVRNRDQLSPVLAQRFKEATATQWVERLSKAGIPAGEILTVNQVVDHPQLRARGRFLEVQHPSAGRLKFLGSPLPQAKSEHTAPPRLGEQSRSILSRRLGLPEEAINRLVTAGVLRCPP
jgi:crotonobetainyl-CoA:carnitine CoA-transferase CaiB-like acyl-CoA transferase